MGILMGLFAVILVMIALWMIFSPMLFGHPILTVVMLGGLLMLYHYPALAVLMGIAWMIYVENRPIGKE